MSKTIVPGVHDFIPPDGRFTLELFNPDTGRVRHRVRSENALMNWYRRNVVPNGGRGVPLSANLRDYDSFCPIQALAPIRNPYADLNAPDVWPSPQPPAAFANWLWANASTATPDQSKHHIPTVDANGEVSSGAKLDAAWAADGAQLQRGTVVFSSCLRTWDRTRMVVEYGLSYGNGIYRSLGLGSLIAQRTGPGLRAMPPCIAQINNYNFPNSAWSSFVTSYATSGPQRGCVDFEDDGFWCTSNMFSGLGRMPPTATAGTSVTELVSLANLPGSGGQISVAVNGSDFWIGRNQTLYRCVKPTSNVAVTVTNTYGLAGTLGAQTILDIAVDRVANEVFLLTSSHVHVINGTTGAPISNFAHGRTSNALAGIEWSKAEDQLHVSFAGTGGSDLGYGDIIGSPSNYPVSTLVSGFTKAGAAAKSFFVPQFGYASGNNSMYSAPLIMLNESGIGWCHRLINSTYMLPSGPTMATHCLLDADVEKDNTAALRITYDFDFV